MKHFAFSPLPVLALLSLAKLGCEVEECENAQGENALCVKSLERYTVPDSDIEPDAIAYSSGMNVHVDTRYGDVTVEEGPAGEVSVLFQRFTYRAHDADEEAYDEIMNEFDYTWSDDNGTIWASAGRLQAASNGLGADVTLRLPPEFDGELEVVAFSDGPINPGDVNVRGVGEAVLVDVSTDSLGDCTVRGATSVVSTRARCDGEIDVSGVSDHVDLESSGLSGNVTLSLAGIADGSPGGRVSSEDGDISITFPSAAVFSVQAQSSADGAVSEGSLPDTCSVEAAADTSKTVSCGAGGPNYVVTAGTDGVGPSNVTFDYD